LHELLPNTFVYVVFIMLVYHCVASLPEKMFVLQKFAAKKGDSEETVSHAQRKYGLLKQ